MRAFIGVLVSFAFSKNLVACELDHLFGLSPGTKLPTTLVTQKKPPNEMGVYKFSFKPKKTFPPYTVFAGAATRRNTILSVTTHYREESVERAKKLFARIQQDFTTNPTCRFNKLSASWVFKPETKDVEVLRSIGRKNSLYLERDGRKITVTLGVYDVFTTLKNDSQN